MPANQMVRHYTDSDEAYPTTTLKAARLNLDMADSIAQIAPDDACRLALSVFQSLRSNSIRNLQNDKADSRELVRLSHRAQMADLRYR